MIAIMMKTKTVFRTYESTSNVNFIFDLSANFDVYRCIYKNKNLDLARGL